MKKIILLFLTITTLSLVIFLQSACNSDNNSNNCNLAAPISFSFTSISPTSAVGSWGAVTDAVAYKVELVDSLSNILVDTKEETTSTTTFNNLSANKGYIVKVTPKCSNLVFSTNVGQSNFHTLTTGCNLAAPTNVAVTNITTTSAVATWTNATGVFGYQVQVIDSITQQVVKTINVQASPADITGLTPNTKYIVKVYPKCSSTSISPNAGTSSFRTGGIIDDTVMMKTQGTCVDDGCKIGAKLGAAETLTSEQFTQTVTAPAPVCKVYYIRIENATNPGQFSSFRLSYIGTKVYYKDNYCQYQNPPTHPSGTNTLIGTTSDSAHQYTVSITPTSFTINTMNNKVFVEE